MQCRCDKGVKGSNLDKTVVTRKCNVDAGDDGPVDGIVDGNAVDEQDADGDAELESNQGLSLFCGLKLTSKVFAFEGPHLIKF